MFKFTPQLRAVIPSLEEQIESGHSLLRSRRLPEALIEFKSIVARAPELNFIHLAIGSIYVQQRNYDLAIASFEVAMKLDPLAPQAPLAIAQVYLQLEELEQAEHYFQTVLAINPHFDLAWLGLGQVAFKYREYDLAIKNFSQAIAVNSKLLEAYLCIAEVYRAQGQLDQAIVALESADKNAFLIQVQLGRLYREKLDYKKAYSFLYNARNAHPLLMATNQETQLDLLESSLATNALETTEALLKDLPDFVGLAYRANLVQGNLGLKQGNMQLAIQHYLQAWQLRNILIPADQYPQTTTQLRHQIDRLKKAFQAQEFTFHYQPIVDLETSEIVSLESLLRWESAGGSLRYPGEFLAETIETGLLLPIGWWGLHTVSKQWQYLSQKSSLEQISINLSEVELQDSEFAAQVAEIMLERNSFQPQNLLLEINTQNLSSQHSIIQANLQRLQSLSIPLGLTLDHIDDNILNLLRQWNISVLKLKYSFIQQQLAMDNGTNLSRLMNIAKQLDCDIVAVGIETETQAKQIRSLGFHYAQGYLFGAPTAGGNFIDIDV